MTDEDFDPEGYLQILRDHHADPQRQFVGLIVGGIPGAYPVRPAETPEPDVAPTRGARGYRVDDEGVVATTDGRDVVRLLATSDSDLANEVAGILQHAYDEGRDARGVTQRDLAEVATRLSRIDYTRFIEALGLRPDDTYAIRLWETYSLSPVGYVAQRSEDGTKLLAMLDP